MRLRLIRPKRWYRRSELTHDVTAADEATVRAEAQRLVRLPIATDVMRLRAQVMGLQIVVRDLLALPVSVSEK